MSGQSAANVQAGGNVLGGISAIADGITAARQRSAARRTLERQAAFLEEVATREAELIREQGDERFRAFLRRADEVNLDAQRLDLTVQQQALEERQQGLTFVSTVMAAAAAHGIDPSSGSALEARAQVAFNAERAAAIREERGRFGVQALLAERRDLQHAGQQSLFAAELEAQSTLLTARGQAFGVRVQRPSRGQIIGSVLDPLRGLASSRDFSASLTQLFGNLGSSQPSSLASGNTEILLN